MKFQEITEKEYRKFWENHPLKTFLSSPEIGKLREKSGWKTKYVGVKKEDDLVAATMLVSHIRKFGKEEYYSPRGYLIDFKDKELVSFFTKELKQYVKDNNGYVLRIDPYVIHQERDIDGNIVEGGEDNTETVEQLKQLGFKKVADESLEQVGWMFSLGLEGKDEEQILKEMQSSTRNKIRKAEKYGITMKECTYDDLEDFYQIMEETSKRKGFANRKLSYFQEMYQLFSPKKEVKYLIAELNLKEYIETLEKEKEEKNTKLEKLQDEKNAGARKSVEAEIDSLNKRIEEAEETRKETGKDTIVLSGAMFILIKPEIIYLAGGNYEEYMKYDAQYLLQWEMIKYGIENGYKKKGFIIT